MCQPNPVRAALAKVSTRELESAIGTCCQRQRDADDSRTADLFKRIADDMTAELYNRLLTIATRDILAESREATKLASALLTQMTS